MRFFSLFLSLLLTCTAVFSQYDPSKISKKGANFYEQAMTKAQSENFKEAINLLMQALKTDPGFMDAYLSLGGLHLELKNYTEAIRFYEIARPIDANYFHEYRVPYSIALAGLGRFKEALSCIDTIQQFGPKNAQLQKQAQQRKKNYAFAVEFEEQNPPHSAFQLSPMSTAINSPYPEYFPSLTIDRKELVFTRLVNHYQEDFFVSKLEGNEWTKAEPLPGKINSGNNEGASNISQDGEWLIFTGCNFRNGYGSCDLYISFRENDEWTIPYNLGPEINTEHWESAPSLSPDKKHLYFSSNRPGGFGGSDIYVSVFDGKKFGKPQNLGPIVNTAGDESCPFIHADNMTLYFTSNGHAGYGGDDIFYTRKEVNKWSTPKNLGYPINTIENEGSLFIEADGKTAYYASSRAEGQGSLDIYTLQLPSYAQPITTDWVKGKVYDSLTKKGIAANVQLYDLSTNQLLNEYQTDASGLYLMTIPKGREYAFSVQQKGYLFYSDNYSLKEEISSVEHIKNIPLQPLRVNATIHLKNIFFASNEYELLPASTVELETLYALLKDNNTLRVEISGHTDNVGSENANKILSEKRAASVVNFLLSKGISKDRLIYKGYGESAPIAPNDTEENRALNRRTSVKIIQL
ncbi:OmpA family protein [Gynurincola endophyticus]|uniref:OmpA family protein n=1 Tax=Gynurincola endophyticus TaxID=2479004 RepID=UPI000F8CABBB|nr:OmpA family protein [Gynurincola endophyticus]